jgi:hypothetical protein
LCHPAEMCRTELRVCDDNAIHTALLELLDDG